jgi:hypothetical protein
VQIGSVPYPEVDGPLGPQTQKSQASIPEPSPPLQGSMAKSWSHGPFPIVRVRLQFFIFGLSADHNYVIPGHPYASDILSGG